jgi:membrane-bound serine protease (ClpP class)
MITQATGQAPPNMAREADFRGDATHNYIRGAPTMRKPILFAAIALIIALPLGADVLKIVVDDMIHPITEEYIARAVDEAVSRHDSALLIELRTPGGLEASTRKIVEKILASPVPVIIWVAPGGSRAASAGFFILESADIAAMAPGTNTGAAHPVTLGGEKVDDIMKQKMENDSAAFMRSVAAKRHRNVAVAESAVRESKSFTEQEALGSGLIDLVAGNQSELLAKIDGRKITRFDGSQLVLNVKNQPVRSREMTLKERLLSFLMDPNVAYLLFALGALAIWAEFSHPGAIVPGVVGLVAIALALIALNILPTRFAALGLILVAFLLFILEAKYATHGVLGIGGVIAMTLGALMLVDGPIPEMRVQWYTALSVSLPFGLIAIFLMTLALRAQRGKVVTGSEGLIGEIGVARTPLAPEGKIFVHGELWDAVATTNVSEGSRVRVRNISGLTLEVEPVSQA